MTKETKTFYKTLFLVGLPMMIQQFVSSSLNFIDNLMIGRLGKEYIAAIGFASSVYRVFDLCLFGIYSGMGIFLAQYYGQKNYDMIKKIFGLMVKFGLVIGFIFSFGGYFGARRIIEIFSKDPIVIEIGISYLTKIIFCYIFYAMAFSLGFTFRSMGKTKVPMIASIVGVLCNTGFNYLLIYGKYGFPRLEERGAAYATILARAIEFFILLMILLIGGYDLKGKIKDYAHIPKDIFIKIIKKSIPVFFTETLWILGTLALTAMYAKLGTDAAASMQISEIVTSVAVIIFMGVANAAAVMVGHTIGQGDRKKVVFYSGKILYVSFIMAIFSVIVIELITVPIVGLYDLEQGIHDMAVIAMRITGAFMFFKTINWAILIGLFRAGGDTKIAFFCDTAPLWLYAVPMAYIGVCLGYPLHTVILMAESGEIIKLIIGIIRYRSMRWIKDVTA